MPFEKKNMEECNLKQREQQEMRSAKNKMQKEPVPTVMSEISNQNVKEYSLIH